MDPVIQSRHGNNGHENLLIRKGLEWALDQQGVEENLQDDWFQQWPHM
jgi:hypothetical protein